MGRGRKGPIDQSVKKPKIRREEIMAIKKEKQKETTPVILSENLLQEMQRIGGQNLMRILLPRA